MVSLIASSRAFSVVAISAMIASSSVSLSSSAWVSERRVLTSTLPKTFGCGPAPSTEYVTGFGVLRQCGKRAGLGVRLHDIDDSHPGGQVGERGVRLVVQERQGAAEDWLDFGSLFGSHRFS